MLLLYVSCALVGGALVIGSIFTGDHGSDHDADSDHDSEPDSDHEHEGAAGLASAAMPIASLRFWTFFTAFFGLTGTLLSITTPSFAIPTAIISVVVGYVAGLFVSTVVRRLTRSSVTSHSTLQDFVGATGTVVLPLTKGRIGQVRVELRGRSVDCTAETDGDSSFDRDDEVLVYAIREDGVVMVTNAERKSRA